MRFCFAQWLSFTHSLQRTWIWTNGKKIKQFFYWFVNSSCYKGISFREIAFCLEYLLQGLNWFLMWSHLILLIDKVDSFCQSFFFVCLFLFFPFAVSMSLLSSFLFRFIILSKYFNNCLYFLPFPSFVSLESSLQWWFYCLWSTLYPSPFDSPGPASFSLLGFFFHFLKLFPFFFICF